MSVADARSKEKGKVWSGGNKRLMSDRENKTKVEQLGGVSVRLDEAELQVKIEMAAGERVVVVV